MKKVFLTGILLLSLTNFCSAKELYHIEHVAKPNETLESIANKYITPDRYMPEFKEGIVELNYDEIFEYRIFDYIKPGDVLKINIWY